jgi:hypothetical protein
MTLARLLRDGLVVSYLADAAIWDRVVPTSIAWALWLARGAWLAAPAYLAVRHGRRWSVPLLGLGAALLLVVPPALVGILAGALAARGLGPSRVFASVYLTLLLVVPTTVLGALAAVARGRAATRAAPQAG